MILKFWFFKHITLVTTSTQSYWREDVAKSSNKCREIGEMKFK